MLAYWDSSALLNALAAQPILKRLQQGDHVTRSHGYVEAFHHLSGRGLPRKDGTRIAVTPSDAAAMIRKLAESIQTRDLDTEQTLRALEDAQSKGVSGRMVHDWIAGADFVLTRDKGLSGLCAAEGLKAEWP